MYLLFSYERMSVYMFVFASYCVSKLILNKIGARARLTPNESLGRGAKLVQQNELVS